MPRKPDLSRHVPDPRLDPYRERVARVFRGGEEVGLLLVRVDVYAEAESGRWWWTRWGPTYDVLWLFSLVDGSFSDTVVPPEAVDGELDDYAKGLYHHYGEVLRVRWTTPEESAYLRRSRFGLA